VSFYFTRFLIELNTSLCSRGHQSVMGSFSRPINGKSPRRGVRTEALGLVEKYGENASGFRVGNRRPNGRASEIRSNPRWSLRGRTSSGAFAHLCSTEQMAYMPDKFKTPGSHAVNVAAAAGGSVLVIGEPERDELVWLRQASLARIQAKKAIKVAAQ
jgi:hypothetical protein